MADKKTEEQELKDIFEDKRSFINDGPGGDDQKYYIDTADVDEVRAADWHYSKTYNEALLAGVTTAAQMADILEERSITGKAYEEKRLKLIADLDSAIDELAEAKDREEKKERSDLVADIRNKLFRHNQRASSPMSNTCEQLAEDARVEYLTSAMVKDAGGKRVWKSYDEYKTSSKPQLAMRARYEVMLANAGLSSSFLDETPEAVARKELAALDSDANPMESKDDSKKVVKPKK